MLNKDVESWIWQRGIFAKASCFMDCHLLDQTFIFKTAYTGENFVLHSMNICFTEIQVAVFYKPY